MGQCLNVFYTEYFLIKHVYTKVLQLFIDLMESNNNSHLRVAQKVKGHLTN